MSRAIDVWSGVASSHHRQIPTTADLPQESPISNNIAHHQSASSCFITSNHSATHTMQELDGNSYIGARTPSLPSIKPSDHARHEPSPSIHSDWSGPRALVLCEAMMSIHLDGSHDERTIKVEARRGTWHQTMAIQEWVSSVISPPTLQSIPQDDAPRRDLRLFGPSPGTIPLCQQIGIHNRPSTDSIFCSPEAQANRATLSSRPTMSSPPPAPIPKSKTWSVLSTIQKLPTDHNVSSLLTNSRPTTIPSTVQSTAGILPPRHVVTSKGRTSISRLGKPTSMTIRSYPQQEQRIVDPRNALPADGSAEQPDNDSQPGEAITAKQDIQALTEEQESPSDSEMVEPRPRGSRREAVTLRTPVWGTENDRAGTVASGFLRRSKRFQRLGIKLSRNTQTPEPDARRREPLDDDEVSPTSTPGHATPRWTSPPIESNTQSLAPGSPSPRPDVSAPEVLPKALEAKLIEARQADSHSSNVPGNGSPAPESPIPGLVPKEPLNNSGEGYLNGSSQNKTKANSYNPRSTQDNYPPSSTGATRGTNSKQLNRDEFEDFEDTVTCSLFPSPFRRNSSAVTSPVRERISIFEGLYVDKSNQRLHPALERIERERARSHAFGTPNKKKRSFAWIPKKLRKMSVHRGKDRKLSYASTDEGTRPTSWISEEWQAKLRKSNKREQPATHAFKRKEPDTTGFTPSSSKPESRP